MEYFILMGENIADQVEAVNDYLSNGWECQGGVSVVLLKPDTGTGAEILWSQALVRNLPLK